MIPNRRGVRFGTYWASGRVENVVVVVELVGRGAGACGVFPVVSSACSSTPSAVTEGFAKPLPFLVMVGFDAERVGYDSLECRDQRRYLAVELAPIRVRLFDCGYSYGIERSSLDEKSSMTTNMWPAHSLIT
jgi:hypothetical protein